MTVHPEPAESDGRFIGSTNCMRRPFMTLYPASKALIATVALVGLAACHAGVGIGHSHAGFRVGDNGGRPPLASNAGTSAVAQTSIAQAATAAG
jgi:hypothetical protein